MRPFAVILLALAACGPLPAWIPHASAPVGGVEMHTCSVRLGDTTKRHRVCQEGYACVRDGCEWCGDAAGGMMTRCTEGDD
jgi:hypothetical protein